METYPPYFYYKRKVFPDYDLILKILDLTIL